ncbi:Fc.00g012010.m01.CDS01 [Cosmosporella sp. VM-42]
MAATASRKEPPPQNPVEAQFAAILAAAAKKYSDSSTESLDDFTKPPIKSLNELKSRLDLQNDRFSTFRAKRQKLWSALTATFVPVEVIGGMVAGGAAEVFAPAEGIYAAISYLINAAHDVSTIYDSILELFDLLKDFTGRLDVYVKHAMSAALREKLVAILAALFEVLVLASKEAQRGRVKAYFKRLFGSDSPVLPALEELKALTIGEGGQVLAETYGIASTINVKTDQALDTLNQVKQEVISLRTETRERTNAAHQDKLKEILDPSPFPEDFFSSFNKLRVQGTGEWILEDEGVQSWIQTETPYLWICGAAGTGKSFLTTRLISWSAGDYTRLAYFFFRDNNPETRSVLQALRDIAYQLSETDGFYAKQLLKRLSSREEIRTIPSAFRKLLVQPFEDDIREKTLYIFLDGIDEANTSEVEELLGLLAEEDEAPGRPPHIRVQVALTGRSHMTDMVTFALDPMALGQVCTTVYITPERNAKDVTYFIEEGVRHSRILSRTSAEFKDEIIETMNKQVDGLFILAKFMLAEINRKRHPRHILQSLQSYPKEINGMLMRSLKNLSASISEDEAGDLNEMLRWVACAEETLSLEQLEAVLVLKFGDPPFRLEETLRGQYSCFFDLEREDGLTTDDLIKEYERKQRSRNDSPGGRHSSPGSHSSPGRNASPRGLNSPTLSDDQFDAKIQLSFGRNGSPIRRISSPGPGTRRISSPGPGVNREDLRRQLTPVGRNISPRGVISPAKSEDLSDPKRQLSPHLSGSPGKSGSNGKQLSPGRHFSPAGGSLFDPMNEMEFRSNKSNTYVTFFHSSVKEFFSKENSTSTGEGPPIGFEPTSARIHIVKTCLSIFTDAAWFEKSELGDGREAIKQYAAWYWQEHLAAIGLASISASQKRELGQRVYKMLTDDSVILDWSIMYEKNNEGLEVLTDNNISAIRKLMNDPDVLSSLEPQARDWATKAVTETPGIFKPIGQFYARAWVSSEFKKYIPTLFCFKIVQAIAFMEEGYSWSQTNSHWSEIPIEKRIDKAAEWANEKETAHWHRRVGSTYLTLEMHSKALAHYDQALKLDGNSVETSGRIAFCLSKDGRFREALDQALKCEGIEEASISTGNLDAAALKSSKWRLYKDHMLIARCYNETGQVDNTLTYFQKAIKSAPEAGLGTWEYFEPEIGYLDVLANENRHGDIIKFLREMSSQVTDTRYGANRLVDFFLDQHSKPLVLDWVPRAASKNSDAEFVIESLELAITTAHAIRDPLKVLYLRLSLGATFAYSRDVNSAIALFDEISFEEYRPRGNVPTRQAYSISFQKLAGLYKEKVLHAGLETPEANEWIAELERVQEKQSNHQNQDMPLNMVGSDVNIGSIYLSLFYRLLGRKEEATPLLKALIMDSFDILSDDDLQNDEYALDNLLCILIAANDIENARALSQSMRRVNTMAPYTTPSDSPIALRIEPKLPEIQSTSRSCAQCLEHLDNALEYAVCEYCMDSFCMKCLNDIIKKDGNKTSDHREDVVCRSDHVWFTVPPLNRILHRGEILMDNGKVMSFGEWKAALQEVWK